MKKPFVKAKKDVKAWAHKWKEELVEHKGLILLSVMLLVIAIILQAVALDYTTDISAVSIQDLILDHIPTINLYVLFVYGIVSVYLIAIFYFAIFKVKNFHVVIGQFSLLLLLRSFFLILTHLGQPAGAVTLVNLPWWYNLINFKNDLFFSLHTATPFLFFLVFSKDKIRWFFLIMTAVMAITVLFMHVHYSIDVFAALFITYGSYKIGEALFSKK